ncbi:MAG: hypothetical protein AB7V42_15125 [Thermoleophilia bacterium]
MTTEALSEPRATVGAVARLGRPVAAVVGVWALSLVLWWILVDPEWGLVEGAYPQPAGAYLFWVIGVFIIAAFNFGGWPFTRLRQPLAGLLAAATHIALGCAIVAIIVYALGRWDATFASDLAGETGFLACALIVLPGFYCWTAVTAHWGNRPFADLDQPRQGLAAFLAGAFMTMAGFFILIHPELSAGDSQGPFRLGTAVGWLYSGIVVALLFAMLWNNRPWSAMRSPWAVLLSVPLCLGLGTGLYLLLREVVEAITPDAVLAAPGFDLGWETANLGVCISLWALTWGLVLGAPPAGGGWVRGIVRTLLVGVLALGTYAVYMRWLGTGLLHEPAYDGDYGGFALIWMDWVAMVLLWYAVSFGAPGLRRDPTGD